jgi:hypothetical protein
VSRRRSVFAAGLVAMLLVTGAPRAIADGGSGKGGSGSGSTGSGSGSGSVSSVPKDDDDDRPTTTMADVRPTAAPPVIPPVVVPPEPTVGLPKATASTPPASIKAPRLFERSTACGNRSLRVEVRTEANGLRVRTTIAKSTGTWRAVVMQDRRVSWSGAAREGRIDRTIVDLPGPETITVRLKNTAGVVCAADLQLPA